MTTSNTSVSISSIFETLVSNPNFIESRVKSSLKNLSKEEKTFLKKGKNESILLKKINSHFEAIKKKARIEFLKAIAKKFNISVSKFEQIKAKAKTIAPLFNAGYSMGGTISIYLQKKYKKEGREFSHTELIAYHNTCQEYAKSSKYKAVHGSNHVYLTLQEIENLQIVGGIPTIKGEEVAPKIFKCRSLIGKGSKNNYTIVFEDGFLTSNFHAQSVKQAQNWRKKQAEYLLQNRKQLLEQSKSEAQKKIELDNKKKRFVGFHHSLKAGNCTNGTNAFIKRHNLNPEFGYQLGYILSLEESEFTRRLLRVV